MLFPALVLCCSVLPAQAEQTTFQKLAEYLTENGLDLPDILTDSEGNPDWFIKPPAFIPNSEEYFVIDVRPDSVYEKGHIPGAVRSSFRNLLTTAKQADKPIVVVCHTGQAGALVTAFLNVLGYDAGFMMFGANGMIYSKIPEGPYKWTGPADHAYVGGSEAVAASIGRAVNAAITVRRAGRNSILISTPSPGKYTARVLRLDGTTVVYRELRGHARHELRCDAVADGVYMIRVSGAHGTAVGRFMIR
jgi:rhodanese-related sulfurtransferase